MPLQAYEFQKRLDDNPQMGFKMDDPRQMKLPFGKKPLTPPPNIDNILKIVAAKIDDMKSQIDKEMDDRDIEEALEAADAKGELAAILDPDKQNKNPYAAHLRLTDNDIVNMEPKKKRKKRAKGSTGDGELF